jgi:small redox-active disulfide protein 2
MLIEVLGTGCPKCNKLETMARQAADKLGVAYTLEHVHDITAMIERGVMAPPALVIDGRVVVSGRLPSDAELESWIASTTD